MKNLSRLIFVAVLLMSFSTTHGQDKNNPWAITIGVNAVDPYPVGEDAPQGDFFDEFFNVEDHWNIFPSLSTISVSRYLSDGFTFTATGSLNQITKFGTNLNDDGSEAGTNKVNDLSYYGLDGRVSYSFMNLLNSNVIDPYLGVGGGYSWLDSKGSGTLNGTLGFKFWLSKKIGLDINSTYKHSFENEDLPKHFQHMAGLTFKFGGTDTDGDGIYDKDDACPEEAGLEIFNGCPDSDNDGIQDSKDDCPNTAGLAEFNGCPDSDGDGVMDKNDNCPNVAGLSSLMGCPDADGDGVADADDNCPNEAGDAANSGCPWADADGDGVLDKDDNCPQLAGTVTNNGCPEVTDDILSELNGYSKTILFDFGKTTIRSESASTIQDISNLMKKYPTVNFEIEGHTDSSGSDKTNQRVSEQRAKAVHDYLVGLGMEDARLHYVGYGESRPVADNKTKAGRQENRRVNISVRK
jgi:outer membrane protein OmpA-like peptidoglycan-associated protein